MSNDVKVPLRNLAGELGVSLAGLNDDQMDAVAIRFVVGEELTAAALEAIVEDVRRGAGGRTAERPPLPSVPKTGYRFNATEATESKYLQRLRLAHRSEDARTALQVAPRRPDRLPATKPHPACLAAARDGSTPCSRCMWLLEGDPYTDAWMDRDD